MPNDGSTNSKEIYPTIRDRAKEVLKRFRGFPERPRTSFREQLQVDDAETQRLRQETLNLLAESGKQKTFLSADEVIAHFTGHTEQFSAFIALLQAQPLKKNVDNTETIVSFWGAERKVRRTGLHIVGENDLIRSESHYVYPDDPKKAIIREEIVGLDANGETGDITVYTLRGDIQSFSVPASVNGQREQDLIDKAVPFGTHTQVDVPIQLALAHPRTALEDKDKLKKAVESGDLICYLEWQDNIGGDRWVTNKEMTIYQREPADTKTIEQGNVFSHKISSGDLQGLKLIIPQQFFK